MAEITLSSLVTSTFTKGLNTLTHILKQAEAHAASTGVNPDSYLAARLVEDMRPLAFQLQNITKHVRMTLNRLTGVEDVPWEDDESTFAEYYARIERAKAFVEGVDLGLVDARAGVGIEQPFGPTIRVKLTSKESALAHGIPNFYFHLQTAYAILRSLGVPIGKRDYLTAFFDPIVIPTA